MRRIDRLIIDAFAPAAALLAAGLVAIVAFWGFADADLPAAARFAARWLPLACLLSGLGLGLGATVRLWRRARTSAEASAPDPVERTGDTHA